MHLSRGAQRSYCNTLFAPTLTRLPSSRQHFGQKRWPGSTNGGYRRMWEERRDVKLQCSEPGITDTVTQLTELTAKNFYQFLEETSADLVVVDFYTDWCGPCKLMYPELVLMQEQFRSKNVLFVKFNCNKENKAIGKELDIKVAPTFFLYKKGEKVAEMSGAKIDKLRALIQEHL